MSSVPTPTRRSQPSSLLTPAPQRHSGPAQDNAGQRRPPPPSPFPRRLRLSNFSYLRSISERVATFADRYRPLVHRGGSNSGHGFSLVCSPRNGQVLCRGSAIRCRWRRGRRSSGSAAPFVVAPIVASLRRGGCSSGCLRQRAGVRHVACSQPTTARCRPLASLVGEQNALVTRPPRDWLR